MIFGGLMKGFIALISLVFLFVSCQQIDSFLGIETKIKKEKPVDKIVNVEAAALSQAEKESGNLLGWLRYPAISPDGREIAFAFMGDVYIVPVEGGFARALTSAPSFESMPVWSNDGTKLAFVSSRYGNHDIYVISRNGGSAERVTFHSANDIPMAFSPDDSRIYFYSPRIGTKDSSLFPSRSMPQLYSVPAEGGAETLELPFPVMDLKISADGSKFIYHDKKGYEDNWRKHHVSSNARDIWEYDTNVKKFNKLSDFGGEDRNPVFGENGDIYYLSEESGSFNIWKRSAAGAKTQITKFDTHPVRFLTRSKNGTLCFSYDGQIYTLKEGAEPVRLEVFSTVERKGTELRSMLSAADEVAPNSDGSEAALVLRGEIYVVNTETGTTKRITDTPNEERWVNFHPKNRKLLYSSFRDGTWKVYETTLEDENEPYFATSTKISEKEIISGDFNAFQAYYSPDGNKIAYLKNRTELVVFDTEKNTHTTVLPGEKNVSYIDGDQQYSWSPDSSRLAVIFNDRDRWSGEVGIVDAKGGEVVNITNSGAFDALPKWSGNGEFISWISGSDLYAFFLNKKGLDNFMKTKEEIAEEKKIEADKKAAAAKTPAPAAPKPAQLSAAEKKEPVEFDTKDIEERVVKTSLSPANYVENAVSKDGETLYYMTFDPTEFRVFAQDLREKKERVLTSIPHPRNIAFWDDPRFSLNMDANGTSLFVLAMRKASKIGAADGKVKPIAPAAEFSVDKSLEYAYLFEFVWKTMNDKFYDTGLHGVDWAKYKDEYKKYIPFINNNYDFSELLSEMLGELNVSHTGSGYMPYMAMGDASGRLGIFYSFDKNGVKIEEIMKGSPLDKAESKVKAGNIIEKINGMAVTAESFDKLLNRTADKKVRISFWNTETSEHWEEVVKPTGYRAEFELLYNRWVKKNRESVEKLSGGKLGYVHIRGMDGGSFKTIFDEIMGRYNNAEGIVIDTRFNGGGWLHDDLAVLFGGKKYTHYSHRGVKNFGGDPQDRWTKKTILLVNEGNYSDAHLFPYTYRELKLGKIVGMPVAGTATAVWWPLLLDESLYFGIPQIGIIANDGKYLENNELVPDFVVPMLPNNIIEGRDPQLEKAVQVLLEEK